MRDKAHFQFTKDSSFLKHHLSENVYVLDDLYAFSMLAKLSTPEVKQPLVNIYLRELYKVLLNNVVSSFFPVVEQDFETRMLEFDEHGRFTANVVDPNTKVLVCDVARAGMIPGQVCFDNLNLYLNPENVVFDHIMASRDIQEEAKSVNTVLAGMKIIPEFSDGYILIPDPMGASGSSIKKVIDLYKSMHTNIKIVVMHLIVTPEYVKTITESHPDVVIMAVRYDRGLSDKKSLENEIGKYPEGEKSLTETKYILPGAGGLGEIINNNYI